MSKSNVAVKHEHVSDLEALFGGTEISTKSREGGPAYSLVLAELPLKSIVTLADHGLSEIVTGYSQAGIDKPKEIDFSDKAEFDAAIARWKQTKLDRKDLVVAALRNGEDLPKFGSTSFKSPLASEIDRIVMADLTVFLSGKNVRQSVAKGSYDMPKGKDLEELKEKWLNKYRPEITEEAKETVGRKSVAAVPMADLEI